MEERRATDVYRRAEQELTSLASTIQRHDPLDMAVVSALAKDIADSIARNDQLVVQALAGVEEETADGGTERLHVDHQSDQREHLGDEGWVRLRLLR